MTLVTPRADIAEIRASKFHRKADHKKAMGDRKCDPKSYLKIEKGDKVRSSTYQCYLAPLGMTLEEGVEDAGDQDGAYSTYFIDEPELLSKLTNQFGCYTYGQKAITRVKEVVRPVGAKEMSSLLRLTQSYEFYGGTFISAPLYMVHEQVDFSESLSSAFADLKNAIPKNRESQVPNNVFQSLDSLIDHVDSYEALQAPLQRLRTNHNLHLLGASLSTSLGYEVYVEVFGYHEVSLPFFLFAPLSCREAVISFDALVDRELVDEQERDDASDELPPWLLT